MQLLLARHGLELNEISVRMRLATTRCTNALLESSGENPVLFLTAGFPDLLEIGDQRTINSLILFREAKKPYLRWWSRLRKESIEMEKF